MTLATPNMKLPQISVVSIMLSVAALQSTACQSPAPGQPLTKESACAKLLERLKSENVYPHLKPDCLVCDEEGRYADQFEFAVRFDQVKCGGDSWSNLVDRFVVMRDTGEIRWYDVAEVQYYSFEDFLARARSTDK